VKIIEAFDSDPEYENEDQEARMETDDQAVEPEGSEQLQ